MKRKALGVLVSTALVASGCAWRAASTDPERLSPPDRPHRVLAVGEKPIQLTAALSQGVFVPSARDPISLKIDLDAAVLGAFPRPTLNLALVIDRSKSMAEDDKFEYAMLAARHVIENLRPADNVTIIAFGEDDVVLSPLGPAVNRPFLDHRLSEIGPEGNTNLSAGLLEAFHQLDLGREPGSAAQVIVLTDGRANRGITHSAGLRQLVEKAHARGIGVSTMGCGRNFDEATLLSLAEAGGGRYAYIRSSEEIPLAMARELGGLLEVLAQNVSLEITAGLGLAITKARGETLDYPAQSLTVNLGDIREGEHGVILAELAPSGAGSGVPVAITCRLIFDRVDLARREQEVVQLSATPSNDADRARQSRNPTVALYAALRATVEKAENAALGLDAKGFEECVVLYEEQYETTRNFAIHNQDQELLNQTFMLQHFMAELSVANEVGLLHQHEDARRDLQKEVNYQRYLREHHFIP